MSCQITQEFLHAYVDGELDLARSLEVEQHMQNCQVCASAYRNQTALRSAFKDSSLYYSAREALEKRIRSSLRREAKFEIGRRSFVWRWLPIGALAFLLLMAFVVWRAVPSLRPSGDEFLAQEMGRETNTIGSKTGDVEISRHVVEIKGILEKVRELVQNVE